MPAQPILARPKPTYWLSYLLVMPFAGFIFTAVIGGALSGLLGHKLTRNLHWLGHRHRADHVVCADH